jgi:hypothetical protein
VEASVDIHRKSETTLHLKRHEAVQRRAQSTDRVNGIIIAELVTGQNISAHFHDG